MKVYIRYVGTKVCITNESGGFVMVEREELSESEKNACDTGGEYVEMSDMVYATLRWM
jgi:hypothetical protein